MGVCKECQASQIGHVGVRAVKIMHGYHKSVKNAVLVKDSAPGGVSWEGCLRLLESAQEVPYRLGTAYWGGGERR